MQEHSPTGSTSHGQSDFERLLRPHLDYLYKVAYRFTGATDRAEDLIQDLLVRLYPRLAELTKLEQPRSWLVRVMYRLFIDQIRREVRQRHVAIAESEFAADDENGDPYAEIIDPAPGPDAEFDLALDRQRLMRAWQELSPEHRALLALYEVEGYTLDELEAMLNTTLGTLKSRLHRARRRLADLLTVEPFVGHRRVRSGRMK